MVPKPYASIEKEPRALIESITVKEHTSGKIYSVTKGGTVNVSEEWITIEARIKNIGGSGILYATLYVDGKSFDTKTSLFSAGEIKSESWELQIEPGKHEIKVEAGHYPGLQPM